MTNLEIMSAFTDGQLESSELARAVGIACDDADARAAWQRYHLIGEALRTGRHEPCTDQGAFVSRLSARLAQETPLPSTRPARIVALETHTVRAEAVNEPVFRWKLVAGVASLAAAAAIGWTWVGSGVQSPAGAQLAQGQGQGQGQGQAQGSGSVLAAAPTAIATTTTVEVGGPGRDQAMIRDPRLDEMLAAHRQASGGSQMPSGFLRNATFDGPSR